MAVAPVDAAGVEQLVYYHTGVGTDGDWWDRLAGGALGEGLDDHIRGAYHWLARNYRKGDAIHLLGFSRGAYTARSVGGMIARCGLLDLTPEAGVSDAAGWEKVGDYFRHVPQAARDAGLRAARGAEAGRSRSTSSGSGTRSARSASPTSSRS